MDSPTKEDPDIEKPPLVETFDTSSSEYVVDPVAERKYVLSQTQKRDPC